MVNVYTPILLYVAVCVINTFKNNLARPKVEYFIEN